MKERAILTDPDPTIHRYRIDNAPWVDESGLHSLAIEAAAGRSQSGIALDLNLSQSNISRALRHGRSKDRLILIAIVNRYHPRVRIGELPLELFRLERRFPGS